MMQKQMNFQPKISKEEVKILPLMAFEGEIVVVDEKQDIQPALHTLSQAAAVGIDTETKPTFNKGGFHQVALLQIATDTHCFLFRLNKIGFDENVFAFLADKKILKIGLSLKDDFSRLNRTSRKTKPENFVDLQKIVQQYGILELGLQKIFAIVFGQRISKTQQLSNWENPNLSAAQQLYAATDAWACLKIYQRLLQAKTLPQDKIEQLLATHNPNPPSQKAEKLE